MKRFIRTLLIALLSGALAVGCLACNAEPASEKPTEHATESTPPAESTEESTEATEEPTEPLSDWDAATIRWKPGFNSEYVANIEVRIKKDAGFTLQEDAEYPAKAVVTAEDGSALEISFLGMDYANRFEELVQYMRSQNPDKLIVNQATKLLIEVHNAEKTEICAKVTDMACFNMIGRNQETIQKFMDEIMIRIGGEPYDSLEGIGDEE